MRITHYLQSLTCAFAMLLLTSGANAAEPTTSLVAPAAAARQFLVTWRTAQAARDIPACEAMMADGVVLIGDDGSVTTKAQRIAAFAKAGDEPPESLSEPVDLTAWRSGPLLFFTYRSVETTDYGLQRERLEFRGSFAVLESPKGSQIVFFQETPIPNAQRQAVQINPSIYDRYVGEYSAGPKDHVFMTREGDRLIMTISGDRFEMRPIDNSTFFVPGMADDWVFVSDSQGRVTGLESRHWGQNILGAKVR